LTRVKLTAAMRAALKQAKHAPLRRVHTPGPGQPEWPAHPLTLHALERHALVTRDTLRNRHGHPVTTWTITDSGRAALQPREIIRREPIMYLGRAVPATAAGTSGHGEFTTNKAFAVDQLPVVDPATLDDAWTQEAEHRHAAAADRRERARRARAA
jgi:DNA-binding PadR family transcriptional regulator